MPGWLSGTATGLGTQKLLEEMGEGHGKGVRGSSQGTSIRSQETELDVKAYGPCGLGTRWGLCFRKNILEGQSEGWRWRPWKQGGHPGGWLQEHWSRAGCWGRGVEIPAPGLDGAGQEHPMPGDQRPTLTVAPFLHKSCAQQSEDLGKVEGHIPENRTQRTPHQAMQTHWVSGPPAKHAPLKLNSELCRMQCGAPGLGLGLTPHPRGHPCGGQKSRDLPDGQPALAQGIH